ncbi:MAG: DUF5682 family protein [Pseudomonadota bacterium]
MRSASATLDGTAYGAYPELIWAPIRHHSPRCAWQLRRLIESSRPDWVLVEGPSEANPLLPQLLDAQTRPPVAFFIHGPTATLRQVPVGAQARCFVPLAAMSPEWVALREAQRLGIPAQFIDLPYLARPALDAEPGLEPPLNDDRLLARADAMASLLALSGCADFETWWERHLESGIDYGTAEGFFSRVLQLGQYLRAGSLIDEQTLAREAHMAAAINQARAGGARCLIVCGAFHCDGILEQLARPQPPPFDEAQTAAEVHLVAYSLARLNASGRYAAGIPDCAYQDRVWSALARRRGANGEVHADVNASLALELGIHLRECGHDASLPDLIEAVGLAQRLAALRGHGVGRLELRESLLCCLLKQARDGSEQPLTAAIDGFLAGDQTGRLPAGLPAAPLVLDFRAQCRRLRLPRGSAEPLERALDIYRSPTHRMQSRLLHQLASLGIPYANCLAGPRFSAGEDLQRVREVWSIRWQVETEACLTERSHYGARLVDAATARCLERLGDTRRPVGACVDLLIEALMMGLHALLEPLLASVEQWLANELSLPALCRGLLRLDAARQARTALGGDGLEALDDLLAACFQRICLLLPGFNAFAESDLDGLADALADMLNLLTLGAPGCPAGVFFEALELLLEQQPPPLLAGLAQGALLEAGHQQVEAVVTALLRFCGQAGLDAWAPGLFLAGFLRVARHRLLQEPLLTERLGEALLRWDEMTFLEALPGLRLAFTRLSPRQLRELAARVMPDEQAGSMPIARFWSSADLQQAVDLRQRLASARQAWDGV